MREIKIAVKIDENGVNRIVTGFAQRKLSKSPKS